MLHYLSETQTETDSTEEPMAKKQFHLVSNTCGLQLCKPQAPLPHTMVLVAP